MVRFPILMPVAKGRRMHVVECGIDEALVVGDVIVRVVEIANSNEVRVAISSPQAGGRYQEVTLRTNDLRQSSVVIDGSTSLVRC